jgi:heme/copper-type cytochrome/quinol oxidase subunit 2
VVTGVAVTAATGAVATGTDVGRRALARLALAAWALASAAAFSAAAPPAGPSLDVKVSRRGFNPSRIVLRRGETARLVLASVEGDHCFAVDALRIEKRVASGKPTRLELTPERTGTFPFHCCMETGPQADQEKGELVVSE